MKMSLCSPGPAAPPRSWLFYQSSSLRLLALALWVTLVPSTNAAETKKLQVVTSILPIYCFAANVAGNLADVENLLTPGTDAHNYQFAPRERRLLASADLILVNGLGLEPWLENTLRKTGFSPKVTSCSKGLEPHLIYGWSQVHDHAHGHGDDHSSHDHSPQTKSKTSNNQSKPNPHVWLDPLLACHMVTNILRSFQSADPTHAAAYATNAHAYVARLQSLHRESQLALAPCRGHSLVTAHAAFPYFARRYNLKVAGVLEVIPDVSPTAKHLRALRNEIKHHQVKVIFIDPAHPSKLARRLARDLKVQVAPLDTVEGGLAQPQAYETRQRANVRALSRALLGKN